MGEMVAFPSNGHRPEVFNEEHTRTAWERTVAFFRQHLT
jgi:dienelactone hydrolase